ncbi:MAG: phosphoglycerate mutase [Rhodobacterales bacterium]|nr:MAG: phosphoglycerate mutase [Rhodobacterales bacterium]
MRLILTRHAKSAWDNPGLADHDRVLNHRGRASARAIGQWLAAHGYQPEEALVSSAARTAETFERICRELPKPVPVQFKRGLYHASPEQMLSILHDARANCVLLIAHNPGCGALANALVSNPPSDPRFRHYPTCATSVIDFKAESWSEIQWQSGKLHNFIVPRDLIS